MNVAPRAQHFSARLAALHQVVLQGTWETIRNNYYLSTLGAWPQHPSPPQPQWRWQAQASYPVRDRATAEGPCILPPPSTPCFEIPPSFRLGLLPFGSQLPPGPNMNTTCTPHQVNVLWYNALANQTHEHCHDDPIHPKT